MPKVNERHTTSGRTVYYVRTRDALGRQTSETFQTRKEAEQFAREVDALGGKEAISRLRRKDRADPQAYMPTVAEATVRHIDQLTGVTEKTRLDYAMIARRTFLPIIGDKDVDLVTRADIAGVVNELDKRLAAKSIANTHALLSAVMQTAMIDGLIDSNPCRGVRLPKSKRTAEVIRYLTVEQYRDLLAATPEHHRPLVATLFGTGARWSEVTALNVGDVIQVGGLRYVSISKAWKLTPGKPRHVGPPKSARSRRRALIADDAYDLLQPLMTGRAPTDLLLTTVTGRAYAHGAFRDRVWLPACRAAGLASYAKPYDGPRIHDARHSHASWLLTAGATLEMVQDQLGHESILTTRAVYGDLLPEARNRLAEALHAAMRPQIEP